MDKCIVHKVTSAWPHHKNKHSSHAKYKKCVCHHKTIACATQN